MAAIGEDLSLDKLKFRRLSKVETRQLMTGLLFISPWIIGFLVFTLYPVLSAMYYSLTRYDLLRPPVFIGLSNYIEIFTRDPVFPTVAYNTIYWVLFSVPLGIIAAYLMASLLNTNIRGRSMFRAVFFFPSIIPAVVVAMVWQFLLNAQFGAINATLQGVGLPTIPFISNPNLAKPSLIVVHMWAQGSAIIIFLAALQDVPRTLYEAAIVDGANAWQRFWHVTIPMTTPAVLFVLITGFIYGFQNFTVPWLVTQGGPNNATEFISIFLYRNAFIHLRMGKASALAWILFVIVVIFSILLFKSSRHWVHYATEE
jgi:multiple sugar transport system permease protein